MQLTARTFANVFGAIYLAVGLIGFALTGVDGFTAPNGPEIVVFQVNPLHNVVHLLIGTALLGAASAGEKVAREVSLVIGVVYGVVGVAGFFVTGNPAINILAINFADNLLHLATAAVALLAVARSRSRAREVVTSRV